MSKPDKTTQEQDWEISCALAEALAGIELKFPPNPLEELNDRLGLREVTTDELALILGITDRRISQLWQSGIIPEPNKKGNRYYFPLLESVRDYIDFLKDRR